MDMPTLAIARRLRIEIEKGQLTDGTVLCIGAYAPHLTFSQAEAVIDALFRRGYATNTDPPKVCIPLSVTYAQQLRANVLPRLQIALRIPQLVEVVPRACTVTPSAHENAVRQAMLILLEEGLVQKVDRKFLRVI
jgi:hypothetical protein